MAEGVIIGNVDTALIGQDTCCNLPVGKAGVEGKRDVFIHGLEGLKDEGVASRGRLNAVGQSSVDNVDKEGWGKESDSIVIVVSVGEEIGAAEEGIRAC